MSEKVTEVTKDILPNERIDCVAYGCTSGTIAAGYNDIQKKIQDAKPEAIVTTPSTASIKALKKLNVKKFCLPEIKTSLIPPKPSLISLYLDS